ncbi:MAG: hypothetical protein Q8R00_02060 [Candidatus Nanoarchaeia archaeon]|nr:hypothetical protein [Candidatus Nanoarchaeia archaeon]
MFYDTDEEAHILYREVKCAEANLFDNSKHSIEDMLTTAYGSFKSLEKFFPKSYLTRAARVELEHLKETYSKHIKHQEIGISDYLELYFDLDLFVTTI